MPDMPPALPSDVLTLAQIHVPSCRYQIMLPPTMA
jgi:hypothetical protein